MIKNILGVFLKVTSLTALVCSFVLYGYATFEPIKVNAVVDTDEIVITQTVTPGITISSPVDISLTSLTLTQDTAVADTTWNVITNNQAGYSLTINASQVNALIENTTSEQFTDYTVAAGSKETWSVVNAYEFGWSAFGNDVDGHGTDSDCVADPDVPSATLLWQGFDGTTPIQFASSTSETNQAGTETTLCVATEQDIVFAPSGTYYATTTATATTQ